MVSPVVPGAGRGQATDAQCDDENNESNEHNTANHYTSNLQTVICEITCLIILSCH